MLEYEGSYRIPEIHKFKYCFAGEWIVDVPRFLDYPWFINICSAFPLLKIIKCVLCVYCILFVLPTMKDVDSHKLSHVSGHLKLHVRM